jgi:hypothetical protein
VFPPFRQGARAQPMRRVQRDSVSMVCVATRHATVSVKRVTIQVRLVRAALYAVLPIVLALRVPVQAPAQEPATEWFAMPVHSPTIRHSVGCQAALKVAKFRRQCVTDAERVHPVVCVSARGSHADLRRVVRAVTRM